MYNLKEKTVDGEPIIEFRVWFHVPLKGFFMELDTAISACEEMDFDPQLCISAIPVAITENHHEVLLK